MLRLSRIRSGWPLLAVGLILLVGCWQAKPTPWSYATGAEQFERLWWQDVQAKKWTEVESRLAATFVAQSADGALDRAQFLEYLKSIQISEYSIGEVEVHPAGDSLVITYIMDLHGSMGNRPLDLRSRMMTVWQKQKHG